MFPNKGTMMAGCWPIPQTASHLYDIEAFPLVTALCARGTWIRGLRLENSAVPFSNGTDP